MEESIVSKNTIVVPIHQFGKDHWSLLAYVADSCQNGLNGVGTLNKKHLRCNPENHPFFTNGAKWDNKYSSRLKGYNPNLSVIESVNNGTMAFGSDDYNCLADLEKASLIKIDSFSNLFVSFTDFGINVASDLFKFKAKGGTFKNFDYLSNNN